MAHPIRVLIVDDVPMLCAGLAFTLERGSAGAIAVVGTAHDGLAAIEAVHAHHPDVVLMDIQMPRLDGLSATARLRQLPNPPEVIVITTFDADDEPVRAARAGASGFLLKSEDPFEVIAAIKAVAAGEGALSRRTAKQLLGHVRQVTHLLGGGARTFAGLLCHRKNVLDVASHIVGQLGLALGGVRNLLDQLGQTA